MTRYKYESAFSTKDLYLQYRPEYDSQRFVTKVTNATRYGSGAGSDHDELAQFTYTFNAAGDRLSNARHRGSGGNAEGFSKMQQIDAYAYDTLHRLTTVDYNTGGVTGDEVYVYDSLGNRVTYTDQRNSITRAYANNKANEYTSVATFGVTHDPAGNLARQVVDGSGNAYVYNYDCDNRLLNVQYDPVSSTVNTALATFAYDALGRRITAWTQFDINAPGGDNQTKDLRFYHDGQVEIADYDANGALSRRFINGTQYIDERAVLIEGTAAAADTFYYLLQELYTVTGLIEKNGALAEANVYDGYGKVTLWDYSPGDFDRDGDVDTTDQISFNAAKPVGGTGAGVPAKDPMADLDMDGDVDNTDSTAFTTIKNAGGAVTEAFVSSIGNPFFFTGRRLYFLETLPEVSSTAIANQQLQHNRARDYIPDSGRWTQEDPVGYLSGNNLFEYVASRPINHSDSLGLCGHEVDDWGAVSGLDWWQHGLGVPVCIKGDPKNGSFCKWFRSVADVANARNTVIAYIEQALKEKCAQPGQPGDIKYFRLYGGGDGKGGGANSQFLESSCYADGSRALAFGKFESVSLFATCKVNRKHDPVAGCCCEASCHLEYDGRDYYHNFNSSILIGRGAWWLLNFGISKVPPTAYWIFWTCNEDFVAGDCRSELERAIFDNWNDTLIVRPGRFRSRTTTDR